MLDPDTPVPPLLKQRCRLAHDQIDQLIEAIYGRTARPPLRPPRTVAKQRSFVIHLSQPVPGQISCLSFRVRGYLLTKDQKRS